MNHALVTLVAIDEPTALDGDGAVANLSFELGGTPGEERGVEGHVAP
jgi:hypothetical protein